ncbi:MAG: cupin domain-containing protein [Xanthobacteraceae bacterium]|nr:cupin domain-containing protein [Xanthobacteraceae bacterium]
MASLVFADGREATDTEIAALADQLGLVVQHQPVPDDLAPHLEQALPDAAASADILDRFPPRPPYRSRDLIALHPQRPDNDELARKFERWHRHDGDEVRYILDGAGIFRILVAGGPADLHVGPGDFINVPSGLEHSFRLTEIQRIKAIRYFSDPSGWAAEFTGRD